MVAMGLVGERKALAAAVLLLYALFFLLNALLVPEPSLVPLLSAFSATYGIAFFALVAGYFWARWFAIGLGLYGFSTGVLILWQLGGMEPIFVFYTGTHIAVALLLWGNRVSSHFDGRADWRQRFHLDDAGTHRLGRAVIRAGFGLPFLLLYLAPRDDAGQMLFAAGVVGLVGFGLWGLIRMRTWGLLAMGAGASFALIDGLTGTNTLLSCDLTATGSLGALFILAATTPFAAPALRFLRQAR